MVNTRRMESVGSAPNIGTQHRTRRAVLAEEGAESSSASDIEDSQGEEEEVPVSRASRRREDVPLAARVRELRSRFVYSERKRNNYPSRVRSEQNRKRIINERHRLTVYSSRKMHDDLDMYNENDSEDDIYTRSRRPPRYIRNHMSRIDRRSALSLRPISQKCYADPSSPLHFSSDFAEERETGVRRSKRQRKVQFGTLSWLADDQMHKIGYPNLNPPTGYSEEDSMQGPEVRPRETTVVRESKSRREVKNPKYLYDYETNVEVSSRRRSSRSTELALLGVGVVKRELRSSKEHDKENSSNKAGTSVNSRVHRPRRVSGRGGSSTTGGGIGAAGDDDDDGDEQEEDGDEEDDEEDKEGDGMEAEDESAKEGVKENGVASQSELSNGNEASTEKLKEGSSGSDEEIVQPRSRLRSRPRPMRDQSFAPRRTRNEKRLDSSSDSENENGTRYSLRNRAPKPVPQPSIKTAAFRAAPDRSSRRRFTRRRQVASDSGSSSDSDEYIQAKPSKLDQQKLKSGGGQKIMPIGPETLDLKIRFKSIGGLDSHITCLKEMILLPMMYPEVYKQFQIQPPRGVLFHGPPGTGKTLMAKALANESSQGGRKVSFFMRKGADLLSKWIGESEKLLRMLFEQATEMAPSIIFFDELDGLAPVRSSRQDQIHASIVSTLLALMDGLQDRGEVIIIGATNRIDAIDPALRRPGRFDRELFFPLPAKSEREDILKVHVAEWSQPPSQPLITYLAENTNGYCGSDLRALCTEAVIQSFRRTYPQVYEADHRLELNAKNVKVQKIDFLMAKSLLVPASHRVAQSTGRKLEPFLEPLFADCFEEIYQILGETFPHGLNPKLAKVKLSANVKPSQLLLAGETPECGQTTHVAPAVLHRMEHIHTYTLDLGTLFKESGRTPEEASIQVFTEARRNIPSVLYIPSIDTWWHLVSDTVKAIVKTQMAQMDPHMPILLFATSDTPYEKLPAELQSMFSRYRKEVSHLRRPSAANRKAFLRPLLIDSCLKFIRRLRRELKTPPPLPRAPTPPTPPLTEEQERKLNEKEEIFLRELRIFLRDICKKLASNKLFYMFTKPVDTDEVPDYTTIIKQPMDLETMMVKVDFHRYECAKDFLEDIELIVRNALEYNPARTSADKQIRHRACSLRDYAYTIIKNEMDSDFEDQCKAIAARRHKRREKNPTMPLLFLPPYIQTPDYINLNIQREAQENKEGGPKNEIPKNGETSATCESKNGSSSANLSSTMKRKRNSWKRGFINRKRRKRGGNGVEVKEEKDSSDISNENGVAPLDDTEISPNASQNSQNDLIVSPIAETSLLTADAADNNKGSTLPLSINCDTPSSKNDKSYLQSPRRRLSLLMSPSELLQNPLDFDDIDQALNETCDAEKSSPPVQCSKDALEDILEQAVDVTNPSSLQELLDLYMSLQKIVTKFSSTHLRNDLPKELSKELQRFELEMGKKGKHFRRS